MHHPHFETAATVRQSIVATDTTIRAIARQWKAGDIRMTDAVVAMRQAGAFEAEIWEHLK